MNQQTHFNELKDKLSALLVSFEDGLDISSPDLTTIASSSTTTATNTGTIANNTLNTATNTGVVSDCVWVAQNQVKVDLKTLNDTTVETNSGNVTAGCQRVCIATDDINLSSLASTVNMAGFLATDITTVNGTAVETNAGNVSDGTQRIAIATDDVNLATINQSTSDLALSLNGLYQVATNLRAIDDNPVMHGNGGNNSGCQRVTIATDDYNISQLVTNSSGYFPAFHVNLRGIHNGAEDKTIAVQAGNVTDGTPRFCIATDDVNMAAINTNLTNIYTILNDVWDSSNHYLKTHNIL